MTNIINNMQSKWPILKSPPVILAIFQLKFIHTDNNELDKIITNDKNIRTKFPLRHDNYHANIGIQGTPVQGISMIKAKADTKINSYIYSTPDQKKKLIIDHESISFTDESPYQGWDAFKAEVEICLHLLYNQLKDALVNRTSIRFVNKFSFDAFSNPLEYFSKTISSESDIIYPLVKYAFKLQVQVQNTDIAAIVNHALEPNATNNFDYFLDIDVLDYRQIKFDLSMVNGQMEEIREVKNKIFFDTIKQKTIDKCN